jgi:ribonuclease Z
MQGIKEIIKLQLRLANLSNYGLHFHELESNESEIILRMIKSSFEHPETPYLHQWFFIRGKIDKRKLNTNAVQNYEIDKCYFQNIKNGRDVTLDDGRVIDNVELTFDPKPNALCFCSDTAYNEAIIPLINGVDVLYHESTFYNQKKF